MQTGNRQVIVCGDRVLIKPDTQEGRTKVGLYLPQTVVEKEPVASGRIVETGPGVMLPNFGSEAGEPWQQRRDSPVRFLPVQAEIGDYALFLKKESVEVRIFDESFLVVPQGALLLVVRDAIP
ncbi:MAG: co-chaperone GroES family protein [Candidatus Sumerlaeia bacterium]|nr:co-chaperone GroES family protein [Candidatus Sumerlaeia bacterium]